MPQTKGNIDTIAIVQEPATALNETEKDQEIYYPYIIDMLFIYEDREEIIKHVKVLPKKITLINLAQAYPNPQAIVLDYLDNAHITQKLDSKTIMNIIENPSVSLHKIILN